MDKSALFVQNQSQSLTFSPNNVHTVRKINSLIPHSDNVPGNPTTLISHLLITGLKMVRQCPLHKDSFYPVLLKNLITTVKDVKSVLCPNIGVSRKTHVFNVPQEQFLIRMITNAKNLKQMN